jgi:hypothetical protein
MGKKKSTHTDPNTQVHSEFETTIGNSFNVVRKETPAKHNDEADIDDPLNEVPGDEYDLINEWDMEAAPAKMNAVGTKADKIPLLIGLLGIVGLIGVIGVVNSLRVNTLKS